MTLILTLGNSEQIIQISDRRQIFNGQLKDYQSGKATMLICANARMAYGYTGLAKHGSFNTQEWLNKALYDCGPPSYNLLDILERLKVRASRDFAQHPVLKKVPGAKKRLSILFSGYLYHHAPPLAAYALLTNYQDFKSGQDLDEAWDQFSIVRWSESRPSDSEPIIIQRVGTGYAMTESDITMLRKMLAEKKSAQTIVDKAVAFIHEMADRPAAEETIGKQLHSVIIPRDSGKVVKSAYHSSVNKYEFYVPDGVTLISDDRKSLPTGAKKEVKSKAKPLTVKKVGRNDPCPCGSGKKFKHCCR